MSASLDSLEAKLAAMEPAASASPATPSAPQTASALAPAPSAASVASPSGSSDAENSANKKVSRQKDSSKPVAPTSKRVLKLYQDGAARKSRIEEQLSRAPPGCTFAPAVNKTSSIKSSGKGKKAGSTSGKRFDRLYASAKAQQARLEKKRNAEQKHPRGCTFKPKVQSKGKSPSARQQQATGRGRSRFNRLYDNAAKTRAKQQRLREQAARQVGTFQPKITKKGRRSASPSPAARFEKLYQDGRRNKDSQRAKQRADREMAGCTFKPKINRRSRSSSARRSRQTAGKGGGGENFAERLLAYGRRAEERLARKRTQQEEASKQDLTFQPRTRHRHRRESAGKSAEQVAAEAAERLARTETRKERQERLAQRRNELAKQEGINFRPRVNKYRRPASARRSRGNDHPQGSIWERLHQDSRDLNQRQKRYVREREQREMSQCTFTPKISTKPAHTQKASPASAASATEGGVFERLSRSHSGMMTLRNEIKKQKEMEECTFKPKINAYAGVTDQPRQKKIWERLHNEKKDVTAREEKHVEHELEQCTFKPQISEVSQELTQHDDHSTPIWDRLHDPDHLAKRGEERDHAHEEAELEGCTFTPQLEESSHAQIESLFGSSTTTAQEVAQRLHTAHTETSARRQSHSHGSEDTTESNE